MPQLPDNPKVIRLTHVGSLGARTGIMNRTYWRYTGTAPTQAEIQTFITGAHTEYTNAVLPHLALTYFLDSVKGVDLSSTTSPEFEIFLTKAGAVSGPNLPAGDCALISFQVERRYRGGHPRWYQSGLNETVVDDNGTLTGTFRNAFKSAFDIFLNNVPGHNWANAGTIQHINASYYHGFTNIIVPGKRAKVESVLRPTPVNDLIVGTQVQAQVASQRRRDALI